MADSINLTRVLDAEFIVDEPANLGGREQIILAADAVNDYVPGTPLAQITRGAATVTPAAAAGNTGNGALGAWTVDVGAEPGVYRMTCIEPAANGGVFSVEGPNGVQYAPLKVGVAYDGPVNGTIADGAVDFVAGDVVTVTVSYASANQWVRFVPDAADESGKLKGWLVFGRRKKATTQRAVALVRGPARVNGKKVNWPAGITTNQKNAAIAASGALPGGGVQVGF